jgi:hypothetical protein
MIKIVAAILLVFGGAAYWLATRPKSDAGPAPIAAEAKQYVRNLDLAEVDMKATDSFVSHRIVENNGKISNKGDRKVKLVELTCIFSDPYGQPLSRERVAIVRPNKGGLSPGETKSFRLPFDQLPPAWNQRLPQLVIAQIEFQ